MDRFLREPSPVKAICIWLTQTHAEHCPDRWEDAAHIINRHIAYLDGVLNRQVNEIIHSPQFQQLESSWRGLSYLVHQVEEGENIKLRILSVSWKELSRDFERAVDFDQSHLFRSIYSEEFDTPGGEPYGVLLGDYDIRPRPSPDHRIDDLGTLRSISQVAAAAFAPFIAAAHPAMFGLDNFTELEQPLNLNSTFSQVEYVKWNSLRKSADARFLGLTVPRILMRLPYEDTGHRVDGFRFHEDVASPDRTKYLWGNACYAFGAVLVRAFANFGWLADIRGVRPDADGGGLVSGLPVHSFGTDVRGIAIKNSTDATVVDVQEKEMGELGFVPLCRCKDTEYSAFYSNQSLQKPKLYDSPAASINARLSTMLQYMFCVSRFAHYVKIIARDKMGSFVSAADCEQFLHRWLLNYIITDDKASFAQKASYPLREGKVEVRENPGKPGSYICTFHFRPHFQLDQLSTAVRLKTELNQGQE